MGTCRFHLQVPNLQMSCSDLTSMIGYQAGSANDGHQATYLTETQQLTCEVNIKGVSFVRLEANLYSIITILCCL